MAPPPCASSTESRIAVLAARLADERERGEVVEEVKSLLQSDADFSEAVIHLRALASCVSDCESAVATAALDAVVEVAASVSRTDTSCSEVIEIDEGGQSDASASAATLNCRRFARLLLEDLAPAAASVRGDARPGVAAAAARAERALQVLFDGDGEGGGGGRLYYETEDDDEDEEDCSRSRSRPGAASSSNPLAPPLPIPKAEECPTVPVLRSRLSAAAAVLSPQSSKSFSNSSTSTWEQKAEALVQLTALSRGIARRARRQGEGGDSEQQHLLFAEALAEAATGPASALAAGVSAAVLDLRSALARRACGAAAAVVAAVAASSSAASNNPQLLARGPALAFAPALLRAAGAPGGGGGVAADAALALSAVVAAAARSRKVMEVVIYGSENPNPNTQRPLAHLSSAAAKVAALAAARAAVERWPRAEVAAARAAVAALVTRAAAAGASDADSRVRSSGRALFASLAAADTSAAAEQLEGIGDLTTRERLLPGWMSSAAAAAAGNSKTTTAAGFSSSARGSRTPAPPRATAVALAASAARQRRTFVRLPVSSARRVGGGGGGGGTARRTVFPSAAATVAADPAGGFGGAGAARRVLVTPGRAPYPSSNPPPAPSSATVTAAAAASTALQQRTPARRVAFPTLAEKTPKAAAAAAAPPPPPPQQQEATPPCSSAAERRLAVAARAVSSDDWRSREAALDGLADSLRFSKRNSSPCSSSRRFSSSPPASPPVFPPPPAAAAPRLVALAAAGSADANVRVSRAGLRLSGAIASCLTAEALLLPSSSLANSGRQGNGGSNYISCYIVHSQTLAGALAMSLLSRAADGNAAVRAEAAAALSALAGSGLPPAALLLAASAAASASSTAARRCPRARAAAFEFIASVAEEGRLRGIVGDDSEGGGGAAALRAAIASAASAAAAASSSSARSSEEGGDRQSSPFPLTSAASVAASAKRCLASLVRCVEGAREALASYFERECPPAERAALLPLAESLLGSSSSSAPSARASAAAEEEEEGEGEEGAADLLGEMRLNDDEVQVEVKESDDDDDDDYADAEEEGEREKLAPQQPSEVDVALRALRAATGRAGESSTSPSLSSSSSSSLAERLREVERLVVSASSSASIPTSSSLEALAAAAGALLSSGCPRAREAAARVVRAFASTRPRVLLLPSASSSSSSLSSPSPGERKLLLEALVPRLAVAAGLDDDARVRSAAWGALEESCSRCPAFEPAARALSSALRFVASEGGEGDGGETEGEDRGDASAAVVSVLRAAEAATNSASGEDRGSSLFRVAVATGLFAGAAGLATGSRDAAVRMAAVRSLAALWRRSEEDEREEERGPFSSSPASSSPSHSPSRTSRAIESALPRATAELVRLYASRKGG